MRNSTWDRVFWVALAVGVVGALAFWALVIYVATHFLAKWW